MKAFGLNIDTDTITDRQKLIGGIAVGVLSLCAGIYLNMPSYDAYQQLLGDIDKLTLDKQDKQAQVAKLPQLRQELADLRVDLRKMEGRIPRKENIPTLLVDLERVTDHNDVILQSFVPGALTPVNLPAAIIGDGQGTQNLQNQLRQLPVKIVAAGSFPDAVNLFSSFERYERTLAADTVALAPSGGKTKSGFRQLSVTFNLNAYVLLGGANGNP